jgi:thymidylate kinase
VQHVLVWINGAFGAGKTTLAGELHRRLPDALAFDPEYVGYVLLKWVPPAPSGDFQDIPLWRTLVAQFATGLWRSYGRTLITPMTLVNPTYRAEIFDALNAADVPLLHVFLDVPADVLRQRIADQEILDGTPQSADTRAFRLGNVERCVAARAGLDSDALVLRADLDPPERLADRVLAAVQSC